jgi:hypothetical protein
MDTFNGVVIVVVALAIAVVTYALIFFGARYRRYRGTRLVECPETGRAAAVHVNARRAAATPPGRPPELRLKDCSRWPEREDCGQECLSQIENAPHDCLVRTIVESWYREHPCAVCGKSFGEISWLEHKPALMDDQRKTVQWSEIEPQNLPEVLKTHRPVCWNCHVVETLYREHPDLVTERPESKWSH